MTSRAVAAIFMALSCSSCSREFIIEPSGSETVTQLKFYEPGFFWRGGVPEDYPAEPCISQLSVVEEQAPGSPRTVWQISSQNGCVSLGEVVIGKVPLGFVENVGQLPLRNGAIYRATASGSRAPGKSRPWVICLDAPQVRRSTDHWLRSSRPSCGG